MSQSVKWIPKIINANIVLYDQPNIFDLIVIKVALRLGVQLL